MRVLLILLLILLFGSSYSYCQDVRTCFENAILKGDIHRKNGRFLEAKKFYKAAAYCPDRPKNANEIVDQKIEKAETEQKEQLEISKDSIESGRNSLLESNKSLEESQKNLFKTFEKLQKAEAETQKVSRYNAINALLGRIQLEQLNIKDPTLSLRILEYLESYQRIPEIDKIKSQLFASRFSHPFYTHALPHVGKVLHTQFSEDNKYLATVSTDKVVTLWALESSEQYKLFGHATSVHSIDFNSNNTFLLTSDSLQVFVWDFEGNKRIEFSLFTEKITLAKFISDSNSNIVTVSNGKIITYWSEKGEIIKRVPLMDSIRTFNVSPSRNLIIVSLHNGTQKILNSKGDLISEFSIKEKPFVDGYFIDENQIVSITTQQNIFVWNVNTKEVIHKIQSNENTLAASTFSAIKKELITLSEDGIVRSFKLDRKKGEILPFIERINSVNISPEGNQLILLSDNQSPILFETGGNYKLSLSTTTDSCAFSVFSKDATKIATVGKNGTVWVWDNELNKVEYFKKLSSEILQLICSKKGTYVSGILADGSAFLFNSTTSQRIPLLTKKEKFVITRFSDSEDHLICGSEYGFIYIFDTKTGKLINSFSTKSSIYQLLLIEDEKKILTLSKDRRLKIWSYDGKIVSITKENAVFIKDVHWYPEEEMFLSFDIEGSIYLWDKELKEISSIKKLFEKTAIREVKLLDKENILVSSQGSQLKVIDFKGNKVDYIGKEASGSIQYLDILTEKFVLFSSINHQVVLYDLSKKEVIPLEGHTSYITDISFSTLGDKIYTACRDGYIRVFNIQGDLLYSFKNGSTSVTDFGLVTKQPHLVAVVPESDYWLSSSDNYQIIRFLQPAKSQSEYSRDIKNKLTFRDKLVYSFYKDSLNTSLAKESSLADLFEISNNIAHYQLFVSASLSLKDSIDAAIESKLKAVNPEEDLEVLQLLSDSSNTRLKNANIYVKIKNLTHLIQIYSIYEKDEKFISYFKDKIIDSKSVSLHVAAIECSKNNRTLNLLFKESLKKLIQTIEDPILQKNIQDFLE